MPRQDQRWIAPTLEAATFAALGSAGRSSLSFEVEGTDTPILRFHYPTSRHAGFDYVQRSVKLELGSLTDQQPDLTEHGVMEARRLHESPFATPRWPEGLFRPGEVDEPIGVLEVVRQRAVAA